MTPIRQRKRLSAGNPSPQDLPRAVGERSRNLRLEIMLTSLEIRVLGGDPTNAVAPTHVSSLTPNQGRPADSTSDRVSEARAERSVTLCTVDLEGAITRIATTGTPPPSPAALRQSRCHRRAGLGSCSGRPQTDRRLHVVQGKRGRGQPVPRRPPGEIRARQPRHDLA